MVKHTQTRFVLVCLTIFGDWRLLSQTGKQTVILHILPDISRSTGNQTMKFDQLIEHNMRNFFLEKSCSKCGGETSLRPFFQKSKLSIYLDHQSEILYSLFLL